MEKKWIIRNKYNGEAASEIIKKILAQRGVTDINHFINPTSNDLIDWRKLSNINKGLKLLNNHITNNRSIAIVVDSDFDGIASSTIMARYLKHFTDNVTMIYHEKPKAHGLMDLDLEALSEYNLVILPDGLSSEYDKYELLHSYGADILLLDHHPQYTPTLDAITVNCTLQKYPNKMLSGGAVTWKFCTAYDETYGFDYAKDYVDLAASSIISDVMCVGIDSIENRYICKLGFNNMLNPAIKAIVGSYAFNSTAVAFSISNLANACIRSGYAKLVSDMFLSDDKKEIKRLLEQVKQIKAESDEQVNEAMQQIIETQLKDIDLDKNKVLVVSIDKQGIAGLIANKLASLYNRAVIVLTEEEIEENGNTNLAGSCRTFGDMKIKDLINNTGIGVAEGHQFAAGFKVKANELQQFENKLAEDLKDYKSEAMETYIDLEINISDLSIELVRLINEINQITGNGFDKITVAIRDIKPTSKFVIGKKHSCVNTNNAQFLKWNDLSLVIDLDNAESFDCIAEVELNKYNPPIKGVIRDFDISCSLPFEL